MKVERILYGMQTADGRIDLLLTAGVRSILTQKSIEYLKQLKPVDSNRYLWFKAEQVIAYPIIRDVTDQDPKHGGRTWVQTQVFLVNIHDYLTYTLSGSNTPFTNYILPELEKFPEFFDPIQI